MQRTLVVIAHDMRSAHNVGSLLRTAEGLAVARVYLTGYTPYPIAPGDSRLPHLAAKLDKQISKTALGAQHSLPWLWKPNPLPVIAELKREGFRVVALEQTADSSPLPAYQPPDKLALVLGTEVTGLPRKVIKNCDTAVEIPMLGQKESFNVVQAAAMALFYCRFHK